MAEIAKVQSRNQITLPRKARKAVDIRPGDTLLVQPTGPNTLEIKVLPRMTFAEWLERFGTDEPIDVDKIMAEGEEAQADEYVRKFNEGKE